MREYVADKSDKILESDLNYHFVYVEYRKKVPIYQSFIRVKPFDLFKRQLAS